MTKGGVDKGDGSLVHAHGTEPQHTTLPQRKQDR
jgi:hypothetical protein